MKRLREAWKLSYSDTSELLLVYVMVSNALLRDGNDGAAELVAGDAYKRARQSFIERAAEVN